MLLEWFELSENQNAGDEELKRLDILLICLCLSVTLGVYFYTENAITKSANERFRLLASDSIDSLQTRMMTYYQSLNGAAAVLTGSDIVSQEQFSTYVATLDIGTHLPGINGVGFIAPVMAGQEDAFYQRLEEIGETRLTIKPETDGPERFIIERIAPFEQNKEALGLDISFEQGRSDAAVRARATGLPHLTPRILLVQDETRQPGFLLLSPLYRNTLDVATEAVVRGEFLGWVYAPFVGGNLLAGLTSEQERDFDLAVYDDAAADPDLLIFQTSGMGQRQSRFVLQDQIELFGRTWTVAHASTAQFERGYQYVVPYGILIVGLLLTAMLGVTLRNQRVRAETLQELADLRNRQIGAYEQETRAVFENAVTPAFVLAGDSRILFANQAAQACFGYSEKELSRMTFDRLIGMDDAAADSPDYNATGTTKQGAIRFLDAQCNDWVAHDGSARTTAIVRDLSSEIDAVNELKANKAIYDKALSGSRIGVFDVNLDMQTSEVSDTWCEIMGYEGVCEGEDTQQMLLGRIHPEDVAAFRAADAACISGDMPRSISEYRVRFPDNEWRWMRSDAVIVERDEFGTALRMIGTQTDVTDLRHARNALEQSEHMFRQLFSAAPIGMAVLSPQGTFLSVNEAFSLLCGYEEDHLLADLQLSELMPEPEFKTLYSNLIKLVEQDEQGIYHAEHRFRHRSGEERWGLVNISWTYDKNQRRNLFIVQVNDITMQKEIDRVKNEFVSTVSHELRTPLTSIKGALGLIDASESGGITDVGKRLIEIARSNTDRLAAIVNDILDLEKISSGEVEFDFAVIDMQELLAGTLRELAPFAQTHHNTLRAEVGEGPFWVWADHSRTNQVLANLISNACKYSSDDSEVVVRLGQADGQVWVHVENQGTGVPESFRAQIFNAFSQADASATRAKGGTGLGLNIARQIVTRHGGQIGFESDPKTKTVFWFSYPQSQAAVEDASSALLPPELISTNECRVLHLEGDPDFAEVVRSNLENVARVTHVSNLADARAALAGQDQAFDVVIVDWSLSDTDAGGLLDDIFARNGTARVLGLSADADRVRDDRIEAHLVKTRTDFETIAAYVSGRAPHARPQL